MSDKITTDYWSALLISIRKEKNWSQADLAGELDVSRETVARWEAEARYPSIDKQKMIGEIATNLNVASVYGVVEVVNASPFSMILTDSNDYVVAASGVSGFMCGRTVVEQTPLEEQDNYIEFSRKIRNTGFWRKAGNCFEYDFYIGSEKRMAIIHSIGSRGHIFALVQKL